MSLAGILTETAANDECLKQDDVDMERYINARLSHLRSYLPEEWDILWYVVIVGLMGRSTQRSSTTFNSTVVTYIHPSKGPSCTHTSALTRSSARRLLMAICILPFHRPGDLVAYAEREGKELFYCS